MNYNMPYYGFLPTARTAIPLKSASGGIFKRLLGGFNFSSVLNNTQKTLNLVNQAIPLIKQVNPLVRNAKTMFHVMNEFKKVDADTKNTVSTSTVSNNNQANDNSSKTEVSKSVNSNVSNDGGPTFFIN